MTNSPLQKPPDGLLGLLELKTLGRSPYEFPSVLTPVLECTPFYMLRNRRQQSVTVAVTAILTTLTAWTVPQDEVWRVKVVGVNFSRVVGDIALTPEFNVLMRRANSSATTPVFVAQFPATVAADLVHNRGFCFPEGLWMGPGDRLSITTSTTQNAGNNVSLQMDFDSMASG